MNYNDPQTEEQNESDNATELNLDDQHDGDGKEDNGHKIHKLWKN